MARKKADDHLTFDKVEHLPARAFLAAYSQCGNVTQAARAVKISRTDHYRWMERLDSYADAFVQAEEMAGDLLEAEARRRAVDGVLEPVFGRVDKDEDGKIGTIRKYSDSLLTLLVKGAKPEKYRERVDSRHSGRVEYAHSLAGGLDGLSVEQIETLRGMAKQVEDAQVKDAQNTGQVDRGQPEGGSSMS